MKQHDLLTPNRMEQRAYRPKRSAGPRASSVGASGTQPPMPRSGSLFPIRTDCGEHAMVFAKPMPRPKDLSRTCGSNAHDILVHNIYTLEVQRLF